jgi:hypothetical protein
MSLSIKQQWKSRPFVTAPYLMNSARPVPEIPLCCTDESQVNNCSIKFKQWRSRVFGPDHLLAQFKCLIHSASFTIYPIGWLPFGRLAIADVSPSGECLSNDLDLTVFQAVSDAANGIKWPDQARQSQTVLGAPLLGVFKTQKRHIEGVCRLFATTNNSTTDDRAASVAALSLDLSLLEGVAAKIRDGPQRWQDKAKEVMVILQNLFPLSPHVRSLITLGKIREFWGPPINNY